MRREQGAGVPQEAFILSVIQGLLRPSLFHLCGPGLAQHFILSYSGGRGRVCARQLNGKSPTPPSLGFPPSPPRPVLKLPRKPCRLAVSSDLFLSTSGKFVRPKRWECVSEPESTGSERLLGLGLRDSPPRCPPTRLYAFMRAHTHRSSHPRMPQLQSPSPTKRRRENEKWEGDPSRATHKPCLHAFHTARRLVMWRPRGHTHSTIPCRWRVGNKSADKASDPREES